MIDQTFIHCSGIGPKTETRLKSLGYNTWNDCLSSPENLPFQNERKKLFLKTLELSRQALQNEDIAYLVSALPPREHWRILAKYYEQATFFDIETTGLSSYDSFTTVVVAYHQNKLHTFLYSENLDDFLSLIDRSSLLVAFNGNSFDIPFLEQTFNLPEIGCPAIDLRWICYHSGYSGGLKSIEQQMGFSRPDAIRDIDGFEAVRLFYEWQNGNRPAREKLIAYCQADVLATVLVAGRLLNEMGIPVQEKDQARLFEMAENRLP